MTSKLVIQFGPLAALAHLISRTAVVALLMSTALLLGCVATGPAVSKSTMGNLEINLTVPQGVDTRPARIYVDGVFVGNVSERLPVLFLKRGKHTVRVDLAGTTTYEQVIEILGEPNHQVLNVILEKK